MLRAFVWANPLCIHGSPLVVVAKTLGEARSMLRAYMRREGSGPLMIQDVELREPAVEVAPAGSEVGVVGKV